MNYLQKIINTKTFWISIILSSQIYLVIYIFIYIFIYQKLLDTYGSLGSLIDNNIMGNYLYELFDVILVKNFLHYKILLGLCMFGIIIYFINNYFFVNGILKVKVSKWILLWNLIHFIFMFIMFAISSDNNFASFS